MVAITTYLLHACIYDANEESASYTIETYFYIYMWHIGGAPTTI